MGGGLYIRGERGINGLKIRSEKCERGEVDGVKNQSGTCYCRQAVQKYCILLSLTALFPVQTCVFLVVLRHISMLAASTHFEALYAARLGLVMDNTLAQSCLTGPKLCLSIIHLFSGKDGSGQGQIAHKEKKKQAIQK